MEQREKLMKLIREFLSKSDDGENMVDYLLANGVVVLPCRCVDCVYRDDPDVCPVFSVWTWDINDNFFCGFAERKGGGE